MSKRRKIRNSYDSRIRANLDAAEYEDEFFEFNKDCYYFVRAVSVGTQIEKDIAGYKIYRTTDPTLPQPDWQLLTPDLLKTNTFQDTRVESGKTYYYYLTATDTAGNVSEMSQVVSETVP